MARSALGKGLDGLIPNKIEKKEPEKTKELKANDKEVTYVKITKLQRNSNQPRKTFNDDSLQELSESIKIHGVIFPIYVQKRDDYYEIIAGERRWRAARLAGLKEVPVIINDSYTEQQIAEISLIENLQREDLNPIEEAMAYKSIMDEYNLKQDQVAERVSKSRATITNSLRLLKLTDKVQQMVVDKMISEGHARALLGVENSEEQYNLALRIFDERLSVREVEKIVKSMSKPKKPKKEKDKNLDAVYKDLEEKLKERLSTKVTITENGKGAGKLEIEFYNNEDLDRILDIING
ncbi:MAG: ParB/RepB/Spo0J family partition protein [Lachnospiraceae bacterium]|nr:ParB/RepB/Spo0J family partition protein [Lachnospiraceae bacterium]